VPHEVFLGGEPDADPFRVNLLHLALGAVAAGADITAGVAADAALKLLSPKARPLRRRFAFKVSDIGEGARG